MSKPAKKQPSRPAPAVKQKAPAAKKEAPVVEQQAPAVKEETPATEITSVDIDRLTGFADYLTRLNLAEFIRLTQKPARMMWFNFISGVARGFGIAVGFTLLGALGIYILRQLQVLNLPLIGDFVAQLWEYVEMAREIRI